MVRVSTESNWRVDSRLIIAVAALIAVLFYLLVSAVISQIGFPLDDTWIHLTYARNLAEHGEWAFRLGEHSAGSTSPLWTFLLSIGFVLKLAPYIWTYLLGWALLALLGIQAEKITRQLIKTYKPPIPWAGLFFVFAWHLTWAAVSGMETLLHAYIVFVVLSMLISKSRNYLALGMLSGVSVWVRPDGLTLLGPVLFTAFLVEKDFKSRSESIGKILIGFGALFVPYLLFNLALSGNPMPNTFYAKQAEYRAYWLAMPFLNRVISYIIPLLASPFLVLLPGAAMWVARAVRRRDWATIASLLWFLGFMFIYLMRMPPYQHARYIIPAFPVVYLWGILGMLEFVLSPRANEQVVFGWRVLLAAVCVVFTYIGARQNAYDVSWIDSEMVQTAKWVQQTIPPDKLLAVHDIGAMGYFDQHKIVDLAGLVSPDVVPFIRDQDQIAAYLDRRGVDYLITFPSFYPQLTSQHPFVFPVHGSCVSPSLNENICVYQWK